VLGDPTHVEQILLNLALNARDAMPDGGVLWIATEIQFDDHDPQSDRVVISVSDSGTGIAPEVLDRIFDPFVTTKEPGKGTGLGLAMVASIVQAMQGDIKVSSTDGATGTSFEISLPRQYAIAAESSADITSRGFDGAGRHVLLVEDDAAVRASLARALERCNFTVSIAASPADALRSADRNAFDIVLTDTVMPGMSGVELARRLRVANAELPIVLMSGYSREAFEGESDVDLPQLRKPFTVPQLLEAFEEALSSRHVREEMS
jgi:CheY-like chemotaxis protein